MSGTELANIINKNLKIKPSKVLDSPKHGNRHENMPTVNHALKGRKIQKKFTKIHFSCVFFCPTYTCLCLRVCSMILTNSSVPPPLNFGLEVNYKVIFSVQCSDNKRAVASVWQGGGKCPP